MLWQIGQSPAFARFNFPRHPHSQLGLRRQTRYRLFLVAQVTDGKSRLPTISLEAFPSTVNLRTMPADCPQAQSISRAAGNISSTFFAFSHGLDCNCRAMDNVEATTSSVAFPTGICVGPEPNEPPACTP